MKLGKLATCAALTVATMGINAQGEIIGFENFDGGAINLSTTSNVFDFGDGGGTGGDVFGRVVPGVTGAPFDLADDSAADVSGTTGLPGTPYPTDSRGVIGQNSSGVFGIVDADGISLNNAVWTFDISSATQITSITMDIGAMGDWEAASTDGIRIEARVDANAYQTIFLARVDESVDNYEYRAMDGGSSYSENDPLELFIDGSLTAAATLDKSNAATGALDTYTSNLLAGLSGSTLDIQVRWEGSPSGGEAIALDNFTINGEATDVVPEPASVALLLAGGALIAGRRRKQD